MSKPDQRSRFVGTMIGGGLGDAIGELACSAPQRPLLEQSVGRALILRYTDDTAMAIGVAESILQNRGLNTVHLGDTFRRNYYHEPWRGYASGPPTVFSLVAQEGMSCEQAASSLFGGTGSFGNGAAMRIAPAGLFFHDSGELYERCRAASAVTHSHPVGIDGAAVLARAVGLAVTAPPERPLDAGSFLDELERFSRSKPMKLMLGELRRLLAAGVEEHEAAAALGTGVAVQESVPFALYAFLSRPDDFAGCLFCAALNGGDRDTLAAMACALAGARGGLEAIPESWRNKLENHRRIEDLATALWAARRE